ncbi:Ca-transporting ATPase [Flagelloscypha sp. PMI_526]|nr:Ca-transporting ATPase [Flagelloscypha sp. PMI_526]
MTSERRRAHFPPPPPLSSASSSTSAYRPLGNMAQHAGPRTASPPASAYFPHLSPDPNASGGLRPTPDAGDHFAYSTTLRRHPTLDQHSIENALSSPQHFVDEASSLWGRALATLTGHDRQQNQPESGQTHDTASAVFAHTSIEDTIAHFRTSTDQGLLARDIPALLNENGYNEFTVSSPEPAWLKFAKSIYESPLILLLCGSAIVSAVMGNLDDAASITIAVLIVLTVGFIQERRSEKSLEALNKLVPHHCHVTRDGRTIHILANELVPGDIIQLTTGDRVPADIRLFDALDLEIDESSLTGETEARRKTSEITPRPATQNAASLAERNCIGYMGTLVRSGRGAGVVIATGTETEFGVIFSMMQDVEERRTPLQLSMDKLAQNLSFASFGIIGVICLIGVLQSRPWLEMFTIGVSLAVAAIPEGLPIVTTVTLALGVLRMAKRKAIVKKLHSVESLGSVSVICSDKTGTLTKNEQTVMEAYVVDETVKIQDATGGMAQLPAAVKKTVEIGALCNNAQIMTGDDGNATVVGQATDVALLNVCTTLGINNRRATFNRTSERPFSSEHKFMAVTGIHSNPNPSSPIAPSREIYYMKGAIEAVLPRCKFHYVNEESTPGLDENTRATVISKATEASQRGLRVVAMAYGYINEPSRGLSRSATPTIASDSSRASSPAMFDRERTNLVFAGFQAMLDPPRPGVAESLHVVMITGDAEGTAVAIAKDLGMQVGQGGRRGRIAVLTGAMIDSMSKAQLKERVGNVSVFARTTPKHKMAIVEAFQARGAVVAMTGDGVNDAPALKMADIGVSMGKSGTDVAKEAADVILVDDNFSTILPAVEEGKSIFHNIQNFLAFQLSTAAAALTLITLSTMFGLSNPLNAMQILFINILMDGPPSQSLGVDPVDPAIMKKRPRKKDANILTRRLMYRVGFSASIIIAGVLFIYMFALEDDTVSRREQTMTFTAFVFLDLTSAIQNRSLATGLTQNKMLIVTVGISAITQFTLIYVPFMQSIFQTAPLGQIDMALILLLVACSFTLHQLRRTWERRDDDDEIRWQEEMA